MPASAVEAVPAALPAIDLLSVAVDPVSTQPMAEGDDVVTSTAIARAHEAVDLLNVLAAPALGVLD